MDELPDLLTLTDDELVQLYRAVQAEVTGSGNVYRAAGNWWLTAQTAETRAYHESNLAIFARASRALQRVDEEMARRLGLRLRAARLARGLSESDVANLSPIFSLELIASYEQGISPYVFPELFEAICSGQRPGSATKNCRWGYLFLAVVHDILPGRER
jgi:hypothetical protein